MKAMTDFMFELKSLLKDHARRYPLMQPEDAVKLIYQNEFGGGHLIRDEQACINHLRREYESVQNDPDMPLYESIGNGIVRVHLSAVKPENLEQLGRSFIASAAEHKGSMGSFLQKLDLLRQLTVEGVFCFDTEKLDTYLSEYKKAGCPMVSHSEIYRLNYRPAYRIVIKKHADR